MAILKFILIVVLVWYVLKLVFQAYGPFLMQFLAKKLVQKMEKDFVERQQKYEKKDVVYENENVIIRDKKTATSTASKDNKKIEDVDYEEVI